MATNTKTTFLQEAQQDSILLETINENGYHGDQAIIALKAMKLSEADMGQAHTFDEMCQQLGI